ncbi:MAG: putative DNA binding domain-containing protein [Melioribacteraceae bacterium]|jgi:predicted HTH transcriptional regulator|nr:putative DNA binding domain-containing protein [Melioribacteraceae bacterium]
MNIENQNIEYQSIWKDEYLKWVCGFANAKGGTIFIGTDDAGNIWGRGIRNTIDYCIKAGLPKPYFRKMGPGLAIVFEKEVGASNFGIIEEKAPPKTWEKTSEKILEAIFSNKRITIFELARKLGKTTRAFEMSI